MDTKSFYKVTKESSAEGGGGGSGKPGSVCHNIYFVLEFMIIFFIQACTRSRETVEECQGRKAVCLAFTFCTAVLVTCWYLLPHLLSLLEPEFIWKEFPRQQMAFDFANSCHQV